MCYVSKIPNVWVHGLKKPKWAVLISSYISDSSAPWPIPAEHGSLGPGGLQQSFGYSTRADSQQCQLLVLWEQTWHWYESSFLNLLHIYFPILLYVKRLSLSMGILIAFSQHLPAKMFFFPLNLCLIWPVSENLKLIIGALRILQGCHIDLQVKMRWMASAADSDTSPQSQSTTLQLFLVH